MDDTGGAGGLGTLGDGPGAGFLRAGGEIGDQAEQVVAGADHAVEPRLFQADGFQELFLFFLVQLRDFRLDGRGDDHGNGAFFLGLCSDLLGQGIAFASGSLVDIAHVEHGLCGQKVQALQDPGFLGVGGFQHACRLAVLKQGERRLHDRQNRLGFLVAAGRLLLQGRDAALKAFHVGDHQLGLDGFGVRYRVDSPVDMGDVVILEAAQNVRDGVDFTDVGQELVAEAFPLGRAAHQAGNVHKRDAGGDDFLGTGDLADGIKPWVRHGHLAGVRLDGAERIVGSLGGCGLGKRVEERGLADIRQSDNAALETHGSSLSVGLKLLPRYMPEAGVKVKALQGWAGKGRRGLAAPACQDRRRLSIFIAIPLA